jgi:predicted secreted protein
VRWFAILLAAALAVLAGVACGGAGEQTYGENETSIEAEAGDRFRIELPANPGVGDAWLLAGEPDPSVARFVRDGFDSDAGEDVVGAEGVAYFVFEAVAPGTTQIGLQYCYRGCGSAEGEPPERLLTFDVAVR